MPEELSQWYAIRVRSRSEKIAALDLGLKGFEVCAAVAPQRRVWADRIRVVDMPLFPGYIFANFDPARRPEVERAARVASVVRFGGQCYPVDPVEIAAVRKIVGSGAEVQRVPFLQVGTRIEVKHGPFQGTVGVLVQIKNQYRLVVAVTLLQRAVSVEIDEAMVAPLPPQSEKARAAWAVVA